MIRSHSAFAGERIVGRILEDLRADGYPVFHDLPGAGDGGAFNVDHLLMGPGGVFVIETKTMSKPAKGTKAEVDYDGQRVLVNGLSPDRDPIAQGAALADFVRDLLRKQTGRSVEVRAVVVYPTRWVNEPAGPIRVWALNEKRLLMILRSEPPRLSSEDIALYANAIEVAARQATR